MSNKKVIWSHQAKQSLRAHHDYIKQDSPAAAKRVTSEIIKAANDLSQHPEKYQVDEYYPNNPWKCSEVFQMELPNRFTG